MTSKERYLAESLLQEAERDFHGARKDVRSAALSYERCRDMAPLGRWTAKARAAWNLNVMLWISTAIALEEALEKVMMLDRDAGLLPSAPVQRPIDLSAVDGDPAGSSGGKPLRSMKGTLDQLDPAMRKRLNKTGENFNAAAEAVRQARAAADQAYAAYRDSRATAPQGQVDELREVWRTSLVVWSQALGDRETAREKALAALQRTDQSSTDPQTRGSAFTLNVGDYEPEEDPLF